jgi:hypothetical protein
MLIQFIITAWYQHSAVMISDREQRQLIHRTPGQNINP